MKLIHGDCLQEMKNIPDASIDAIITDPPYGTTKCKWDSVIPLDKMWEQLERVIKPNGAIVMTACQPFTSKLVLSNIKMFKYCLVWKKSRTSHFAQAPYRFMTTHEDIVIFSFGGVSKNASLRMVYNPQGLTDCRKVCKGKGYSGHRMSNRVQEDYVQTKTGYPRSILEFKNGVAKYHPTQKPVALMEYLIKTYTNEGETVLDFAMGSGTAAIACLNTKREFIGIELDEHYFKIAKERIL